MHRELSATGIFSCPGALSILKSGEIPETRRLAAAGQLVKKVDLSFQTKGRVPFLSPNKKGTKEVGIGGCIRVALPRAKCILSLCTPTLGALSKTIRNIQTCIVKAGRGLPKGAYLIAGAINSAPLWTASFGTFLAGARKVHTRIRLFSGKWIIKNPPLSERVSY